MKCGGILMRMSMEEPFGQVCVCAICGRETIISFNDPNVPDRQEFEHLGGQHMNIIKAALLTQIAKELVNDPKLKPEFDTGGNLLATHCNWAAHLMYTRCGGPGFLDDQGNILLADQIICRMQDDPKTWRLIELGSVQDLANNGSLVFGVANSKMLEEEHGHLSAAIPGIAQPSLHWATEAPMCVNIGKDVFMDKSMAWAFRKIPIFFVWTASL